MKRNDSKWGPQAIRDFVMQRVCHQSQIVTLISKQKGSEMRVNKDVIITAREESKESNKQRQEVGLKDSR